MHISYSQICSFMSLLPRFFYSLHFNTTGAYIFGYQSWELQLRQWSVNRRTVTCMYVGITVWQSYIICFSISSWPCESWLGGVMCMPLSHAQHPQTFLSSTAVRNGGFPSNWLSVKTETESPTGERKFIWTVTGIYLLRFIGGDMQKQDCTLIALQVYGDWYRCACLVTNSREQEGSYIITLSTIYGWYKPVNFCKYELYMPVTLYMYLFVILRWYSS